MKKLVFLSVAMAAMMMLSCGGNTHQAEREEDTVDAYDQIRDHTLYGLCGAIPSTSQLKVITDVGDTLTLDITPALENRKMLGSVRVGDRLAVMTNKNQTEASEVININLLLGDWVMPDPLDGSDEIGIRKVVDERYHLAEYSGDHLPAHGRPYGHPLEQLRLIHVLLPPGLFHKEYFRRAHFITVPQKTPYRGQKTRKYTAFFQKKPLTGGKTVL